MKERESDLRDLMEFIAGVGIGVTIVASASYLNESLRQSFLDEEFCAKNSSVENVDLFESYDSPIELKEAEVTFQRDGKIIVQNLSKETQIQSSNGSFSNRVFQGEASEGLTLKTSDSDIQIQSQTSLKDSKEGVKVNLRVQCH